MHLLARAKLTPNPPGIRVELTRNRTTSEILREYGKRVWAFIAIRTTRVQSRSGTTWFILWTHCAQDKRNHTQLQHHLIGNLDLVHIWKTTEPPYKPQADGTEMRGFFAIQRESSLGDSIRRDGGYLSCTRRAMSTCTRAMPLPSDLEARLLDSLLSCTVLDYSSRRSRCFANWVLRYSVFDSKGVFVKTCPVLVGLYDWVNDLRLLLIRG